jgi:acyl carrier protein
LLTVGYAVNHELSIQTDSQSLFIDLFNKKQNLGQPHRISIQIAFNLFESLIWLIFCSNLKCGNTQVVLISKGVQMNKTEFINQIAEILEIEPLNLSGTEVLEEIGNWDSLSIISFVAMVDTELKIIVDPEKLKNAKTINDLIELVGL